MANFHQTAVVHNSAEIGVGVEIGPYTIVHSNVKIGAGSKIGAFCEIGLSTPLSDGSPLVIGKGSIIRSHSVFYESSEFGERLITGHRVTVRENTIAGKNLQIGTLGDVQGSCVIGEYVRMHSNVHIGKNSKIGNFVWIFPYVVLTNDPHPPSLTMKGVTIEDYVALSTMSVILPGVTVRNGTLVGAHSLVSKDTNINMLVAGNPAKEICEASKIRVQDGSRKPAYPWRRHFHRGYPIDVVEDWKAEFEQL